MLKLTVARNDDLYECFPDIAAAPDGALVCTYRESMAHGARPFSRIIVRRSQDGGYTWLARQVIYARDWERGEGDLNCPRITTLANGTLLLVIDHLPAGAEHHEAPIRILLFRSSDCGVTWQGPEDTGITVGIVPSIKQLSNGDLLLGLTREAYRDAKPGPIYEEQLVYRSSDLGHTWEPPAAVPGFRRLELNEGDFAELDDGTVICYMREDTERLTGWKSLSHDSGRTWSEPFRAGMFSCLGRPSVGRLRSGEILITYRFMSGVTTCLGLFAETPEEAVRNRDLPGSYAEQYRASRFAFLDVDRSVHPDGGYSGWVQLPSGDLYVVNYVTDDAPRAQIRGYLVSRQDWFLFPEGDLPWVLPFGDQYVADSEALVRAQFAANRTRSVRRVPTSK